MKNLLYENIYNDLKTSIQNGTYKLNDKLPSEKELAQQYDVSTITAKKSLDLLKEEGYIERKPRKGSTVISLKEAQTQTDSGKITVGFLITNFSDFFGTQIVRSIVNSLPEKINIILKISNGEMTRENKLIQDLLDSGIQGLILLPSSSEYVSPKILELVSNNFPLVIIDRAMTRLPICTVQTDNTSAAKDLTSYLLARGHHKIGLIASDSTVATIDERVNGFLTTHIENNLTVQNSQILSDIDSVVPGSKRNFKEDIAIITKFIKSNPSMTAILTTEFNIALLVIEALHELGKEVPTDISLVCFDHSPLNSFSQDSNMITHIEQNQTEMGEKAIELLLKKIKDPDLIEKINLPYHLEEGNTVKNLLL